MAAIRRCGSRCFDSNPDLQAFFATQQGLPGGFALPEDSAAIHEALLAAGYESTLLEFAGSHGTAIDDYSREFPRLVDFVVAAVDAVR